MVKASGVTEARIEQIDGPDQGPCYLCRIRAGSLRRKQDAILDLVKLIRDRSEEEAKAKPFFILIPEPMVSIIIGRGGGQVKQLQEKSGAEVFVSSTKYHNGTYRAAQIKGRDTDTAEVCRLIYEVIERRAPFSDVKGSKEPVSLF